MVSVVAQVHWFSVHLRRLQPAPEPDAEEVGGRPLLQDDSQLKCFMSSHTLATFWATAAPNVPSNPVGGRDIQIPWNFLHPPSLNQ